MSTTTGDLGENAIESILRSSIRNNKRVDVTGLLLFSGFHFIQILEGPADSINRIYFERIVNDTRHSNLLTLTHEAIESREFDRWKMAIKRVDQETFQQLPEFDVYESASESFSPSTQMGIRVRKLLSTFQLAN